MDTAFLESLGYGADGFYAENRPQNATSRAYQNVLEVRVGAGLLFGFSVYNSKGSAQFVQIFDQSQAPATGDIPVVTFTVATVANFGANWIPPRTFRTGCWIANSSTGPTYTAGSADCFFDVQFL